MATHARLSAAISGLAALACVSAPQAVSANGVTHHETPITVRTIENFRIGSTETRFGSLEFAGGLEMVSTQRHFGALSGLVFLDGNTEILAVADTGFWLTASLQRDPASQRLLAVNNGVMQVMTDAAGQPLTGKWQADAEGIAMDANGGIAVSFEREHRLEWFSRDTQGSLNRLGVEVPPVALNELRHNRGFEGIDYAPSGSALRGSLVGVSEKSLDASGNIMAFVRDLDGASFEFSVERDGDFDVTDIAFLPDGDLVLLERRFTVLDGVAMRLRLIPDGNITSARTVRPDTLLVADMGYQIDNMEGLTVSTDRDGVQRLTLMSDDNHSILQRNLLLEFRLVEPVPNRQ